MQTLNDVDLLTKDYCGNYSTGIVTDAVRYRAINRAIEWIKRNLGIQTDEKIFDFFFSADTLFVELPSDVNEILYLFYENQVLNTPEREWEFFDYPTILHKSGSPRQNRFSITHINGTKQLVASGYNEVQGQQIFNFDEVGSWVGSGDASDLTQDTVQKVEGIASLSFDVTDSTHVATLTNDNCNFTIYDLIQKHGSLKLNQYLTDASPSNLLHVALKLYSGVSDYYSITVVADEQGAVFTSDEWQVLNFEMDDSISVGDPDPNAITKVVIEQQYDSALVSAVDVRFDNMYTVFPDEMNLVYLSNIKGTDSTGTVSKDTLDAPSDILSFSDEYDDLSDVIAQRAAINLYPQLRGDKDQYLLLKQDFNENMKSFGKRWPRKRIQNVYQHKLKR